MRSNSLRLGHERGLRANLSRIALAIALGCASTSAWAQDQVPTAADEAAEDNSDIVVTGTLIRGIAPAGSNTIGITANDISATGVSGTNQLLERLPQASFFNTLVQPGGGTAGGNVVSVINRPNLRNIPGATTSGGALTLILIDGHRVVGAGIGMVAVDPDVVPPGAIERVEAITDGGSAVYGSDAVGGVLNFITRRRFEGVQVGGHVGFADNYMSWDANAMVGKDWGSGSLYIAYGYAQRDPIYGIDRDYVQNVDWNPASATFMRGQNRQCDIPNAAVTQGSGGSAVTRQYAGPGYAQITSNAQLNTCDISDFQALYMGGKRHNVFASLTQELSDWLRFDMQAFYTNRTDFGSVGPARGTATLQPSNPFYNAAIAAQPGNAGLAQVVNFSYGPAFGNYALTTNNTLETWNVTPSFTMDLGGGGNWQLRTLFNYGESTTKFDNVQLDAVAQSTAVTNGVLNPYNIAASPAAGLQTLLKHNLGIGKIRFLDVRAVLDGSLLSLPGGDLKVALGAEYTNTNYWQQKTNTANFTMPAPVQYNQKVTSFFGEAQVPIFGADNGFGGMRELLFSASGRYDRYDDFGSTFNPKLALTWKPVDWIKVTANWGKSFRAPSPSDQLGPLTVDLRVNNNPVGTPPPGPTGSTYNPPLTSQFYHIQMLRGNVTGLKPERSTNWSIGTQIQPPFVPGLTLGVSYYRINYYDAINSPIGSDTQAFYAQFPNLFILSPTYAQIENWVQDVPGGVQLVQSTIGANYANINRGQPGDPIVALIMDARGRNLGVIKLGGIDFNVNYKTETGFGGLDFTFAGNYQTLRTQQNSPTAPLIDLLSLAGPMDGRTKLRFQAIVGADIGRFRAQASLYHTGGFALAPGGTLFQDRLPAANVVNLYFKYDFTGEGIGKDLTLSLNINNVFDKDPPLLRDGGARQNGFANFHGSTIGRFVQVGINKRF